MNQVTIVLMIVFIIFFLACPILGVFTNRRRNAITAVPAGDPGPKDLYRARRKLSTVTTFSVAAAPAQHLEVAPYHNRPWWLLGFSLPSFPKSARRNRNTRTPAGQRDDLEANAIELDLGECPICIGPLVPEPVHVEDSLNAREILDTVTTVGKQGVCHRAETSDTAPAAANTASPTTTPEDNASRDNSNDDDAACDVNETDDIEPGDDRVRNDPWSRYKRRWTDRATARARAGEDDILSLNTCTHAFHAKCLASWFLIRRYDCPVCRTVYFDPSGRQQRRGTQPETMRFVSGVRRNE